MGGIQEDSKVQTLEYSKMFILLLNKNIIYSQTETKMRNYEKQQLKKRSEWEGHLWKVLIRTKFENSILCCIFGSTKNRVCLVSVAPYSIITIELKLCKKFLFCYQPFEITLSATELLNFSTFQLVLPQEEYDNLNNF